ncbi:virion protein [Bacillus phage AR9]|uniref:Virion protein n=1 Tax=Bacillus phage AR9 TaxID=1815509 RepID=A0A172JHY8_BPPB1|nr:virion structural protein [Bacillus phage AR9]AMS01161.1 virion protein [Bacillus phage AR9]
MNEKQLKLVESSFMFNEAIRVSKGAPDLKKAIEIALKETNAKAQKKGLTPVKSVNELKDSEELKAVFSSSMKSTFSIGKLTKISTQNFKTFNGQVVITEEGPTAKGSIRTVYALYRSRDGKIKTVKVNFKPLLNMKGKMK